MCLSVTAKYYSRVLEEYRSRQDHRHRRSANILGQRVVWMITSMIMLVITPLLCYFPVVEPLDFLGRQCCSLLQINRFNCYSTPVPYTCIPSNIILYCRCNKCSRGNMWNKQPRTDQSDYSISLKYGINIYIYIYSSSWRLKMFLRLACNRVLMSFARAPSLKQLGFAYMLVATI